MTLNILLIEDDPGDAGLISAQLRQTRFNGGAPRLVRADSLAAALLAIKGAKPDLILLDLALPDSSGIDTVASVHALAQEVPIVVLSGQRDADFEAEVLEAGAQDYLVKGEFDGEHIGRTIRHARTRARLEARLKLQDAALRAVANGIVITDIDATIQWANPAFSQITGYALNEVLGRKPKDLISSGLNPASLYENLWRTILAGQVWRGELVNKRKDGSLYDEELAITPVRDSQGTIRHFVAVKQDVSDRHATEERIRHLAFYDALTNLPNRRLLRDRLHQALAAGARKRRAGALLFIDLDNFKGLNDTLGHDIGDLLLIQVARRLMTCVREGDTVSRLGGDEFVVMLEDLSGNPEEAATQAEAVGEKVLTTLNRAYILNGSEQHSTPSIGIALFHDAHDNIDDLLKRADLAMYQAKEAGRNTLRFFDAAMQARVEARAALEAELRRGLRGHEFELHYQPQVDADARLVGAEALLRWRHPSKELVMPADFVTLAEETGLIIELGHWALEQACRQLHAWSRQPATAGLTLSVNVSARQFRHPDFVDQVLAIVDHTHASPRQLKLELTESLLLDNVEATILKMTALKAQGIGFALDDFGIGYSSLSYLKRLPLDQLKIDRSFVKDVLSDAHDAAIARTIIALGNSLGMPVIAEGVELPAQRDFLVRQGCRHFQGYLFGRPVPIEQFPS